MPRATSLLTLCAAAVIFLSGCSKKLGKIADPQVAKYIAVKRQQAKEMANFSTNTVPATLWKFFDAVEQDDFHSATNLEASLQAESGRGFSAQLSPVAKLLAALGFNPKPRPPSAMESELWSVYIETIGIYEVYHEWDNKWLHRFAKDVIESIPKDSIYFGGTDAGRFVISAFSESHASGLPFYTLTQNALADGSYLDYLRTIYGLKIKIATPDDSQLAFKEYLDDAQVRMKANALDPGEDVKIVDNRVQVSGQMAVMKINARIAKTIFDKNLDHEFYLEESFPLDWMYPHLEPHGLIFKINRQLLPQLSDEVIAKDREYWKRYTKELIGDWVTDEISITEICEIGEKVFLRKDLAGFGGDPAYARNYEVPRVYSKLRAAIAGLYAWRAEHSQGDEQQRMLKEADFAFRQALALGPYGSDVNDRYASFLLKHGRKPEAQRMVQTFLRFKPSEKDLKDLVKRVGISQ